MEDDVGAKVGGIEQIEPALIDDRIPHTRILFDIGLDRSVWDSIGFFGAGAKCAEEQNDLESQCGKGFESHSW